MSHLGFGYVLIVDIVDALERDSVRTSHHPLEQATV